MSFEALYAFDALQIFQAPLKPDEVLVLAVDDFIVYSNR